MAAALNHPRYERRTVEWGHWGITFMDVQPDPTKNYGVTVATHYFPCGHAGPCDGTIGSPERERNKALCRAWVERGELPIAGAA